MIKNDILKFTSSYYQKQLKDYSNSNESLYLKTRQLSEETIKTFGIGISPQENRNGLVINIRNSDFTLEQAKQYGIVIDNDKYCLDAMFGRVTIEIKDYQGNLIGFCGRTIDEKNDCKYLNTKATSLFVKKNTLFNLDKAKYYIDYLNKFNYIILVEGQFDVMSLWDKGIRNVVAPMGTALTDEHCKLIRMFTNNVVVCFDGDNAGQKAIEKSIHLLKKNKLNPIPMILPTKMDVDDIVKNLGINEFKNILQTSINASEVIKNYGTYRR